MLLKASEVKAKYNLTDDDLEKLTPVKPTHGEGKHRMYYDPDTIVALERPTYNSHDKYHTIHILISDKAVEQNDEAYWQHVGETAIRMAKALQPQTKVLDVTKTAYEKGIKFPEGWTVEKVEELNTETVRLHIRG